MNGVQKKYKVIEEKILQIFEQNKTPQSRVAILCAVYGFRYAAGNVLSWSIYERQLLQTKQINKAIELLEKILTECQKTGFPDNSKPKPIQKGTRFELVKPPAEIITRAARTEWQGDSLIPKFIGIQESILPLDIVMGIQQKSDFSQFVSSVSKFGLDSRNGVAKPLGLPKSLSPFQPATKVHIPEEREEHPWHTLDRQLIPFLKKWRWYTWHRHPVEREYSELTEIINEKNEAQVNISRALKSLQENKKIEIEGTRKQMLISLLEPN